MSEKIVGHFIHCYPFQPGVEQLKLNFMPSSVPLKERWCNNGLSADFMADYMMTFLFRIEGCDKQTCNEIHSAVSFIANELLENSMKYTAPTQKIMTSMSLCLLDNQVIFETENETTHDCFKQYKETMDVLLNCNPSELFLIRLEQNAIHENSANLGLLTMLNDYNVKLGWKYQTSSQQKMRVITQVQMAI